MGLAVVTEALDWPGVVVELVLVPMLKRRCPRRTESTSSCWRPRPPISNQYLVSRRSYGRSIGGIGESPYREEAVSSAAINKQRNWRTPAQQTGAVPWFR